jgi:imidazolonepropionase-like amidohydrolase
MRIVIKSGTVFDGIDQIPRQDLAILIEDGRIKKIGSIVETMQQAFDADIIDASNFFVMPGLCDYHTHLAYGNAKTEEDIDLYSSLEFRSLRGVFMARRVLNAGVTSICNPGGPGLVGIAIRDAINAGMFDGPRITTAGPYITSRQGLADWYPSWIGQPETSTGHVVHNMDEAVEEIRRQVKDGVDVIKIAMDGKLMRPGASPNDGPVAAFNQEETTRMVSESHRLGRRVLVHARGREACLYSARAGVDVIFHASWIDDEGIDAVMKSGSAICPTLTLLVNNYEFSQPTDPSSRAWANLCRHEAETAFRALNKAYQAGVPILNGSETGFAMTPYGEWHAKELYIMIRYLGMSPTDALLSGTGRTGKYMIHGGASGTISVGKNADLLIVDGDPMKDVRQLLEPHRIKSVLLDGRPIEPKTRTVEPYQVSDFAMRYWNDLYTRERVEELGLALTRDESADSYSGSRGVSALRVKQGD